MQGEIPAYANIIIMVATGTYRKTRNVKIAVNRISIPVRKMLAVQECFLLVKLLYQNGDPFMEALKIFWSLNQL